MQQALGMLKSPQVQKLPMEQKKQFLASKLTEEEISEVLKRFEKGESPQTKQSEGQINPSYIVESPKTNQRLAQTNQHFLMNALNIASISIVTSVGVTYLLDNFKDKKDEVLRQELKERLYTTLQDSNNRLRDLEHRQDSMEHKYLETEEIETVVAKRFEQFENGLTLTDYKNKTLNLKLRAQPNQRSI